MYTIKSYRIEYINFIKHIILLEFDIYIDLTESTSISMVINTACFISSALEHTELCIERQTI